MFKETIKELRKSKKLSQEELAKMVGVSIDTIRRYELGEREPRITELQALAAALGTTVASLMGEPEEPAQEIQSNARLIPPGNILLIPVVSPEVKVCAGNGVDYSDPGLDWTIIEHVPIADGELAALYSADSLLGMYVEGDSMEPQIHDGDMVIFNRDASWVSGNIMVVCLDGRLLVKGLIANGQGRPPILRSMNPAYKDIKITEESFFLVYGRVLRIARITRPKPII